MSVMECSRKGCTNIMCDRYSATYGYICNECFDELVRKGVATNITEFMHSDKPDIDDSNVSYQCFDNIFPDRSQWE